jgi:DNA-directed RNA polymerase specialized sigma24 family protein
VLVPFLGSSGDEAERCLAALLEGDTDRTVRSIVARTLCGSARGGRSQVLEAEDVRADVVVQLLARLRRLKAQTEQAPIENFSAYVASIAYRTCYTHLRRLYPQRARLKNRLRYALTYNADLMLEQDPLGIWRCGLTEWAGDARPSGDAAQRFRREPAAFAREALPNPAERGWSLAETVKALLSEIGEPVDLDLLVDSMGGVFGIDDRIRLWASANDEDSVLEVADPQASVVQTLLDRQYLSRLWDQIRELPVNQRVAILLNLRDEDGRSALPLLPLTNIATIRQIAEALDVPAVELASLWPRLPLDDATIASRLRLTRQQVINLRKSGRARLARRMLRFGNTERQ